jgi:aspartyl-tRNA(Asn)/glutamyl-tRNA(Gln) amidotransferase subunit A
MAEAEIVFLPVQELSAKIKTRQLSAVEVTTAFLHQIDGLNPKVNAFITVTHEEALARARQADGEIAAGKYRGPLHGIPYAPKDILATKQIRTTNGSKVTPNWVPDFDCTIVSRLNAAGAIMLGKLNLLEFAMGSGVLSGFGPARNPWDLAYSPAGSSSGSGVALAAYMTPLSVGTDTGGSIRGPANNCGIVGLKQTYGRVSRYGVTNLSWSLDHAGPMTKSVAANAEMLKVMAGFDPNDTTSSSLPVPDYTAAMTGDVKGLRIGVPTSYFFDSVNPEALKAVHAALQTLQGMGATLVDVEIPHADLAGGALWVIAMVDGAAFHEKRLKETPELFDPVILERLLAAKFYPATEYVKAMRVRTILMEEMRTVFNKCDVMAVPSGNPAGKLEPPELAKSDVKPGSKGGARKGSTSIGDMTGMPGIVIPCGFTQSSPTLPLGIQFYAKPFDEATLFRVCQAYESSTDWHKRRPPIAQQAAGLS